MSESPRKPAKANVLPTRPIERLLTPFQRFLHIQAASGIVLLLCTAIALYLANSAWAESFAAFWHTEITLSIGAWKLEGSIGHLIVNDGLMTIFFFVVGLEIKREIVTGELSEFRKALLPVVAAIGGMVVPAIVYLMFQYGEPGERGWAIPMATDIAFVVGFLALFGDRVPVGLKIFLLSLAIVDDLGAILIIALVFSDSLAWNWLALAGVGFALTWLFNKIGVRSVFVYLIIGFFIWLAFLTAHVHPTVAGVILGLMTPAKAWIGENTFTELLRGVWSGDLEVDFTPDIQSLNADRLQFAARETTSPLTRLENMLHPWVAFVIMPIFALANAGVKIDPSGLSDPVAMAVAAGLFIGKPVGILLACFITIRLGWSALPRGVNWPMLAGGGCLAGIGFTMALFLNALAFGGPEDLIHQVAGKIGTLSGSVISSILGAVILIYVFRKPAAGLNQPAREG
ncbi:MAG: Na+/H+ antiporter NhaA [Planctomycetota bacterium]|nr:Na+/H+ antiporter NhaA [Planctomycetota bacterium]